MSSVRQFMGGGPGFAAEIHFAINVPISAAPARISSGFVRRRSSSFAEHVRSAVHLWAGRRRALHNWRVRRGRGTLPFDTNCEHVPVVSACR